MKNASCPAGEQVHHMRRFDVDASVMIISLT
jgi:hypothetical protein